MRRISSLLTLGLVLRGLAASASAQAPAALPVRIDVIVGVPGPGPARFLNASAQMDGLPWTLEGCVSTGRGSCRATRSVELDVAARTALVQHIAAVRAMPRCEPEGFELDDPSYAVQLDGQSYEGHLPRDRWPAAARDNGPCGAPSRFAAWLITRFGVERAPRARTR